MRSTLFSIPLDRTLDLGPLGNVPFFGIGLFLALWCLVGLAFALWHLRRGVKAAELAPAAVTWLIVAAIIYLPARLPIRSIPIYGYGTMLFLGFVAASSFAAWRLRKQGEHGELAWDTAMWLFAFGILGGRIWYVVTHPQQFFGPDPVSGQLPGPGKILLSLINLPDGGLVLYGSLILAPLAYWYFCRRRGISAIVFGDLVISSVFIGLMFGRMGCLLHGCCYGDACSLPWAIRFPPGSVPFEMLVRKGLMAGDQPRSLALHPTQIYDSINAGLLALTTYLYYPYRRRAGEVMAIGWMLYPINRFLIEFLRSDEPANYVGLTLSQWVSLGLFACGAAFFVWLQRQPAGSRPAPLHVPEPPKSVIKPASIRRTSERLPSAATRG